jgi:dihydroneopterin aldolase
MANAQSSLSINQLNLDVHLGWSKEEIITKQTVLVDIDIFFPTPPKACSSDKLEDTVCYSTLISTIETHLAEKQFKLIEHLSYDIYHVTKSYLPPELNVTIHLIKHPPIEGFTGRVRFSYGDT